MSKLVFAFLALAMILASCKGEKRKKSYDGFLSIPREAAIRMITAYADPRVPHDYDHIIKSIQVNSKQFSDLSSGSDSIKLFTAADTIKYLPTIIIQTITRNSPVSYEYYLFEEVRGTICPPPNDCHIELRN